MGRETTRAIGPGQSIDDGSLRQPLLVRKGDAVTVYTRSPGLQVRTTGRAREDGSRGELISIESMLNRQTFLARVTGSQEVEIYARPADTGAAAAAGWNRPAQPVRADKDGGKCRGEHGCDGRGRRRALALAAEPACGPKLEHARSARRAAAADACRPIRGCTWRCRRRERCR